jgi:hypothetical protein
LKRALIILGVVIAVAIAPKTAASVAQTLTEGLIAILTHLLEGKRA